MLLVSIVSGADRLRRRLATRAGDQRPADRYGGGGWKYAHFGLTANGAGLTYQWQRSGDGGASWADIAGATQAGYTTPATTLADDGTRYRATVAAAGITLTSSAVRLTVTAATVAPAFSIQPTTQTVSAPAAATFSVTATGTALAYQWQRSLDGGVSWLALSGAADPSYGTGDTDPTMDGQQFRVVISNAAGSVTSSAARLTVSAAPIAVAITTQPLDQSVSVGAAAAFSVAATGTPAPSLQWQRSLDGGATWVDIGSATAATFNTGPTALSQSGERYRAVASNGAGTATSDPARLTVTAGPVQPVFTVEPADSTVVAPASATFSAAAGGVPSPTWQWQLSIDSGFNWSNINGATLASYTHACDQPAPRAAGATVPSPATAQEASTASLRCSMS